MIDPQSAAEAFMQGRGVWIDITVISLIVTNLGSIGAFIVMIKKQKKNGGPRPGHADECLSHRDRMMRIETEHVGVTQDLTEIKGDVKLLLQRIPARP